MATNLKVLQEDFIRKINRVNIDLIENGTGIRWRVSPQLLKVV